MNRFSEQQARLGAFVGSGVNYVTAKTALTRSQWLMLLTFAVGAVVVGFVSTRPSAPRPSAMETPKAYRQTSPGSEISKYASPSTAAPQTAQVASASPASSTSAVMPPGATSGIKRPGVQPAPGIEPATLSLLEGLARDIAKINQKIDDLAGRQRQTASRLAALVADTKQRERVIKEPAADRHEPSARKPVASATPIEAKAAQATPARPLTVHPAITHPARKPQRPTEAERRHRTLVEAAIIERHVKAAERDRRIRRRIASRSVSGLRF